MHGWRKSDRLVVPAKFPNNASEAEGRHGAAEEMEGRSLAKEKSESAKQAVDSVPHHACHLIRFGYTAWVGPRR